MTLQYVLSVKDTFFIRLKQHYQAKLTSGLLIPLIFFLVGLYFFYQQTFFHFLGMALVGISLYLALMPPLRALTWARALGEEEVTLTLQQKNVVFESYLGKHTMKKNQIGEISVDETYMYLPLELEPPQTLYIPLASITQGNYLEFKEAVEKG